MQSDYKVVIVNKSPIHNGTAVINIMYRGARVIRKEITSLDNHEHVIEGIIAELSVNGTTSPLNPYPISIPEAEQITQELRKGLQEWRLSIVAVGTILAGAELNTVTPNRMMKYFEYAHLPAHLQEVSKVLCESAEHMDKTLPESAEKTVGLRKLLEAKDCFVRAALDKPKGE